MQHDIVSREAWLAARTSLLAAEKKLAEARTAVQAQRRALPWTRVDKSYAFDTPSGRQTLAELFEDRGRLIVYHFMFAPEWQDGCPGCSSSPTISTACTAICRVSTRPSPPSRARRSTRSRITASARAGASSGFRRSPATSTTTTRSRSRPRRSKRAKASTATSQAGSTAPTCQAPAYSPATPAGEVFHVYSGYGNGGDMPLTAHYPELLR